jgi:DNA polymerase
VTNAVKHFKWTPRGKRRIHERPNSREVAACRPWLESELASLRPRVVVCMGATAAMSLLGSKVRVTRDRGRIIPSAFTWRTLVTIHPSAILRAPDEEARRNVA